MNIAMEYLNQRVNEGLQEAYLKIQQARIEKFYEAETEDE